MDIYVTERGIMFFMIANLKVNRIKKNNKARKKYIPINIDLEEFLIEMEMNEKEKHRWFYISSWQKNNNKNHYGQIE